MKEKQKRFFQIKEDQNGQRFWNGILLEISGDSRVEIKGKRFIITPNLQNVFTDTTGKSLKKLDKTENLTYKRLLKTLIYEYYELNLEKLILVHIKIQKISSSLLIYKAKQSKKLSFHLIDIYTRLEILLGLKFSGHSSTLTEVSNLISELYKRGEIQNKQQY